MSLEAALAEHTTALKANTEALIASNEGRAKAIAAATTIAGRPPGAKDTTTRKKPEDKKPEAVADKPKTLTKEQDEKLRTTVGGWLGAVDDGPARDERKNVVKAILAEFNIKKVTEVDPSDYDAMIEKFEAAINGGDDEEEGLV